MVQGIVVLDRKIRKLEEKVDDLEKLVERLVYALASEVDNACSLTNDYNSDVFRQVHRIWTEEKGTGS